MRMTLKYNKVNTNFDVELAEQYEVQANPDVDPFKDVTERKTWKTGALKSRQS
ncbi:MAG: hypothetical protein ACLUTA_08325 [Blautia wexlerae]